MNWRLPLVMIAALLSAAIASAQDEVVYYHTDATGAVRAMTDAGGAQIALYDYMPFGELPPTNPPQPAEYRQFAGKEHDSATGLDYFGARYYRRESGRFTTIDPVHTWDENLVDPQRWNRYAYVRNNPLRFADPDGRILFDFQEFKTNVGLAMKFGQDGYGFVLPAVAGIAAIGSAAGDAVLVGGGTVNFIRAAAKEGVKRIGNEALVVRGGRNTPELLEKGTNTHRSGVRGVSVESAEGKSLAELSANIPHGQVGCCTVGQVRAAGGDVVRTSGGSPHHATMTGLDPAQASKLLTPTVPNPNPAKKQ